MLFRASEVKMLFIGLIFLLISSVYLTFGCLTRDTPSTIVHCQSCNQETDFNRENVASNPQKVQVEIYYETLCYDTRSFIQHQLYPVWQDLGSENIMEIKWKPYGKARVSSIRQ